jgi:2-C-methyl-D-erythritol 2,4-cyclodiphosphate synthase
VAETRVGLGFDVHRFSTTPPILLGGVAVDTERGAEATSDGDVACHAVADAVLGAANLGDMGMHFPSSESRWHGADSAEMLAECVRMAADKHVYLVSVDLTIISESVRIGPFREAIRAGIAGAIGLDTERVSVKATSTDGIGSIGRDEGLAAMAVVTAILAS